MRRGRPKSYGLPNFTFDPENRLERTGEWCIAHINQYNGSLVWLISSRKLSVWRSLWEPVLIPRLSVRFIFAFTVDFVCDKRKITWSIGNATDAYLSTRSNKVEAYSINPIAIWNVKTLQDCVKDIDKRTFPEKVFWKMDFKKRDILRNNIMDIMWEHFENKKMGFIPSYSI